MERRKGLVAPRLLRLPLILVRAADAVIRFLGADAVAQSLLPLTRPLLLPAAHRLRLLPPPMALPFPLALSLRRQISMNLLVSVTVQTQRSCSTSANMEFMKARTRSLQSRVESELGQSILAKYGDIIGG
jgi:hypothetical protein